MLQRQKLIDWLAAGHKVVFTLHDMASFTGGCHQSLGCLGYEDSCRECPQVRSKFRKPVEIRFSQLPTLNNYKNQIAAVAPSFWMRSMALRSKQFSQLRIEVIENGFVDVTSYYVEKKDLTLKLLDGKGSPMETWHLYGCWPQSANWSDLDYSSSDTADVELTLRFDRAKYFQGTADYASGGAGDI
jgi:hypothetical protein